MSAPIPDDETAIKYFRRNRSRYIAETTIDAYERGAREWLEYLANPGKKSYDPDAFDREPQRFYEAGVGDLRYFFQYLVNRSDLATGTIKLRKSGISTFYQAMRELSEDENRQIDLPSTDNPVEEVDLRDWKDFDGNTKKQTESTSERRISYLKPEEIKALADSVPSPKLRNQLIVELMFHTGVRRVELVNIKLDHINREKRRIYVDTAKSDDDRYVFYPPELETLLKAWLNVEREALATADSDYLFPTTQSEKINKYYVNQLIKEAAENAGLQENVYEDANGNKQKKITAHTLRHSFAVDCLNSGMDSRNIQKLMGHSKIETTEVYLKISDDDLHDRYQKIGTSKLR